MNTAKKNDDGFIEFLKQSDLAQQFRDKQRRELVSARAEKIEAMGVLESESLKVATQINGLKKDLADNLASLRNQMLKAEDEALKRLSPLRERQNSLEQQITEHNAFLRANCDPAITEALEFFHQKISELRILQPYRDSNTGGKKLSGRKEIISRSNSPAIARAIEYCRDAITRLAEIKTTMTDLDPSWLEHLKADVPNHLTMTEKTSWT